MSKGLDQPGGSTTVLSANLMWRFGGENTERLDKLLKVVDKLRVDVALVQELIQRRLLDTLRRRRQDLDVHSGPLRWRVFPYPSNTTGTAVISRKDSIRGFPTPDAERDFTVFKAQLPPYDTCTLIGKGFTRSGDFASMHSSYAGMTRAQETGVKVVNHTHPVLAAQHEEMGDFVRERHSASMPLVIGADANAPLHATSLQFDGMTEVTGHVGIRRPTCSDDAAPIDGVWFTRDAYELVDAAYVLGDGSLVRANSMSDDAFLAGIKEQGFDHAWVAAVLKPRSTS